MKKIDIKLGVPYAAKRHSGHRRVIVLSTEQILSSYRLTGGQETVFSPKRGNYGKSGWPVVEIPHDEWGDDLSPEQIERIGDAGRVRLTQSLADRTAVDPRIEVDGKRVFLELVQSQTLTGPWDEVMAAQREIDEERRRKSAERRTRQEEIANYIESIAAPLFAEHGLKKVEFTGRTVSVDVFALVDLIEKLEG